MNPSEIEVGKAYIYQYMPELDPPTRVVVLEKDLPWLDDFGSLVVQRKDGLIVRMKGYERRWLSPDVLRGPWIPKTRGAK